ncbi:hypothetical protein LTR78_001946 [Recurvomyces mirabilis]|uniref:Uncharacterized protein n=1 Tax=Recurvomyces mirabilis TaxID=574656 RepID=A0AAE1C4H1_9PEZI|nr:hypothetical protein LTR78_001946 [Recurvomyces mirabilis]KAK5160404.1 hypothetical protein LTS14_001416 [Recurvomyces mirabilis]
MSDVTPDDELLSMLLVNLRNAAATFGEGTPPYESIRTTIEDHIRSMRATGSSTNISGARKAHEEAHAATTELSASFANLAFRPKPT